MSILLPVLILGFLGLLFGIGLAIASKKFCVQIDPRLEKVYSLLPGANCGACGFAGCIGFAEALIKGACTVEKCALSQEEARQKIAVVLGVQAKLKIKRTAVLHCNGGSQRVDDRFVYTGIKECRAASAVMQGPKACVYGCIGYGDCMRVCPFGAISMNEENLPVVNQEKCTACEKCVAICPKKLFSLVSVDKNYAVRCKSLDFGKAVMEVCAVGCIACRRCEKACPVKAIQIIDNLSVIDYQICKNHGECFKVCPASTIAKKEDKIWKAKT